MPFHSVPLAAGSFLPSSADSIEQYLELPPEHEFRLHIRDQYLGGNRTYRRFLSAARISGDSMIEMDILHGDVVIFQYAEFGEVESGKVVVIERAGDEEREGAWSLKRLVIEQPRSSHRNQFGDEIAWDDPTIVLRSHNQRICPWPLEPSGRYRVRGLFLRSLRPEAVRLVDTPLIRPPLARNKKRRTP